MMVSILIILWDHRILKAEDMLRCPPLYVPGTPGNLLWLEWRDR